MVLTKPNLPASPGSAWTSWRDEFDAALSDEWIGLRTPGQMPQFAIEAGELRMLAGPAAAGSLGKPAFIGRRLRHHRAEFTTRLAFTPERSGDFAGLLAFMDETHFLSAGKERGRLVVRLRTAAEQGSSGVIVAEQPLTTDAPIELKLALDGGSARVFWRMAGANAWQSIGGPIKS